MTYRTVLLAHARKEIAEAVEFYSQYSTELSVKLLTRFYETTDLIVQAPLRPQLIRRRYRKLNLRQFPYKVIYRVARNTVYIVAFAHQKRRPYYWRGR